MNTAKPLTRREERRIAYIVANVPKRIKEARLTEQKRICVVCMYEHDQEGNGRNDFVRPRTARAHRWMNAQPRWLRNDAALAWRYLKSHERELGARVALQPFINAGEGGRYMLPSDAVDALERFRVNKADGFAIVLELE